LQDRAYCCDELSEVDRQDPWECLISFICSSNNNISRITLMLDRLRRMYGSYLCTLKRSDSDGRGWVVETGSSPSPAFNPQVLIQEEVSLSEKFQQSQMCVRYKGVFISRVRGGFADCPAYARLSITGGACGSHRGGSACSRYARVIYRDVHMSDLVWLCRLRLSSQIHHTNS
jgi:hypothetical protein